MGEAGPVRLYGRATEQAEIDRLLAAAMDGRPGSVIVRGEAGIGKSALLDYAAATAQAQVLRVTGVESETELPFAALHLLLRPALHHVEALPRPQADALRGALGLGAATPGDRFLIGLATLSLLTELSATEALVCLVDDVQWLDRESADALLFAARRLHNEPVAVIFAARDEGMSFPAPGLTELRLAGLEPGAAGKLLAERGDGLALAVRDQVAAEAQGNPLALIELPRTLTPDQRAGAFTPLAFSLGGAEPAPSRVLAGFRARIEALPPASRSCLLVAALEGSGDLETVTAAVEGIGASLTDFAPAERAGLVRLGASEVRFHHPLVRLAAQAASDVGQRQAAHKALAAVLGDDRRGWHLAATATQPDEEIAAELENVAVRAAQRGGQSAASAAWERAAELSTDTDGCGRRLTAAAIASADVGQLDRAGRLADRALRHRLDPASSARLAFVRARREHELGVTSAAASILLDEAAPRLGDDPQALMGALATAVAYAWQSGPYPNQLGDVIRVEEMASRFPEHAQLVTALSRGIRLLLEGDPAAAVPHLDSYVAATQGATELPFEARCTAAFMPILSGNHQRALTLASELVAECRAAGCAALLPRTLTYLALAQMFLGRYREAEGSATEALRLAEATDQPHRIGYITAVLSSIEAIVGDEDQARSLAEIALTSAVDGSPPANRGWAVHGLVALDLAAGRYAAVLERLEAEGRSRSRVSSPIRIYTAPDHVEAAVRSGRPELAADPLTRFSDWAHASGSSWASAVALRCAALAASESEAESLYRKAVGHHAGGDHDLETARTELVYGEWLRRQQRRAEARAHLTTARELFDRIGARRWAERAVAELQAAGYATNQGLPSAHPLAALTPQELQVVQLAATGASNREIGAQLFLSPRTVAFHLYKAFPKLGVSSRAELGAFAE